MKTKTAPLTYNPPKAIIDCSCCLFDSSFAKIESDGRCEYCHLQEKLKNESREPFTNVVERIKKKGKGKKYDCLVGISGGEDSSVLLYLAVEVWGLRPLVIHFDNWHNVPEANNNIDVLVKNLNVDFIRYYTNKAEYDLINDAMLWSGTPDVDITNDVIMGKLMDQACKQYGIKYILNGHSFREEGSSPAKWSRIDGKYLSNVYTRYTGRKMENYPILTIWDQVWSAILGIKQIRPFHYEKIDRKPILTKLYSWGWKPYGPKHCENYYTMFAGWLLQNKFDIDKRKTYLSAQIREKMITKFQAQEFLLADSDFNPAAAMGSHWERIEHLINNSPKRDRSIYGGSNFKKWKPVLWILMKLGVFPTTAYHKYCK
jgi:3'-phosphoadenosine 5'-phosphosulfate sulfotransferase (PAPS reductase)/FAD synthetase